jgi:hypothetical protein
MLTRKQLDGWNNGDEREIRHTTPGSPRFLICTSVVDGGPRNGEPGPSIASSWMLRRPGPNTDRDRAGAVNKRAPEMTGHQEGVCMASMKKEEARRAVLSEYDRWAKKHPDDAIMMGGFLFFRYLQNERSDLLDFRAVGDKWQIVHGWLRDWVKD